MITYTNERIGLFIDGTNLFAATKGLGFTVDFRRLMTYFRSKGHLVRALYYTTVFEDQEYNSIKPLLDWLDYNGFTVVSKPVKEFTDLYGRRKAKGNMDVDLAIDVMLLAEHLDHIVLFSGDGDFRSLVEAVQSKGKRVSVVSTLHSSPPMIADELRRQADQFVDLVTLQGSIERVSSPSDAESQEDRPQLRPKRVPRKAVPADDDRGDTR